jgi:hypothetical protein
MSVREMQLTSVFPLRCSLKQGGEPSVFRFVDYVAGGKEDESHQ